MELTIHCKFLGILLFIAVQYLLAFFIVFTGPSWHQRYCERCAWKGNPKCRYFSGRC